MAAVSMPPPAVDAPPTKAAAEDPKKEDAGEDLLRLFGLNAPPSSAAKVDAGGEKNEKIDDPIGDFFASIFGAKKAGKAMKNAVEAGSKSREAKEAVVTEKKAKEEANVGADKVGAEKDTPAEPPKPEANKGTKPTEPKGSGADEVSTSIEPKETKTLPQDAGQEASPVDANEAKTIPQEADVNIAADSAEKGVGESDKAVDVTMAVTPEVEDAPLMTEKDQEIDAAAAVEGDRSAVAVSTEVETAPGMVQGGAEEDENDGEKQDAGGAPQAAGEVEPVVHSEPSPPAPVVGEKEKRDEEDAPEEAGASNPVEEADTVDPVEPSTPAPTIAEQEEVEEQKEAEEQKGEGETPNNDVPPDSVDAKAEEESAKGESTSPAPASNLDLFYEHKEILIKKASSIVASKPVSDVVDAFYEHKEVLSKKVSAVVASKPVSDAVGTLEGVSRRVSLALPSSAKEAMGGWRQPSGHARRALVAAFVCLILFFGFSCVRVGAGDSGGLAANITEDLPISSDSMSDSDNTEEDGKENGSVKEIPSSIINALRLDLVGPEWDSWIIQTM
eukprot:CAMPEP_0183296044 /NCGR_PEP_ID=MMETSP0160_2-20130417/3764_1 /TAXON_ID=2839 ORGANISM="Odontella Sinensis, Strain Grunow 1884" /NCGR_SAMPLE_ID=MMETSP0160_2 /ASSEMBLY_ACC=CAM_ASM_000250 /LENGTH=557 /DNA_ID=CAMNT_0025457615 /DNA_START=40 /DNA_END=1713 /DNA_ORIENTATION=-